MFEELTENLLETPLVTNGDFLSLLWHFLLNWVVVFCIICFFYYPKSRRRDYYFTFTLISISIFLMIFLLGSVKLKIGFALGLFAIFGIIRYRTESMPVREMTYLFVIIAISVINALGADFSYLELVGTNLLFIVIHLLYDLDGRRLVLRTPELFDVERCRAPQPAPTQPHRTKAQPSAACLF